MWVAQCLPLAGRMKGQVLTTGATWMLNLRSSCRGEVQALSTLWGGIRSTREGARQAVAMQGFRFKE